MRRKRMRRRRRRRRSNATKQLQQSNNLISVQMHFKLYQLSHLHTTNTTVPGRDVG
jgi:hypothetical protein